MTKKKNKTDDKKSKSLNVYCPKDGDTAKAVAQTILRPSVQAARTIQTYDKIDDIDINALTNELVEQINIVNKGDLRRAEGMLISQAQVLDTLFGEFARKAKGCEYLSSLKAYMNIALRSQSQCRATLEALAEIKNPRPYIQNNRAQYQQVNNGAQTNTENPLKDKYARAEEKPKSTNGLLEDHTDEWMDTGTPDTPSPINKELETVGT